MVTADEANDIKSNYASGNDNDEQYDNFYLEFEEAEQQEDEEVVKNSKAKPAQRKSSVMNRKSYTVEEKLKIIQYAEENNNRATGEKQIDFKSFEFISISNFQLDNSTSTNRQSAASEDRRKFC